MALLTLNGDDVFDARISVPRLGNWTAKARVDTPQNITGAVVLQVGDRLTLNGHVRRGGEFIESAYCEIVAGPGRSEAVAPKHFVNASVRSILTHLLPGDPLAATADVSVLATVLPAWTVLGSSAGHVIDRLMATLGSDVVRRRLPDGTTWVGRESWPDSGITEDEIEVLDEDPAAGTARIGIDVPRLLPGTTLLGRRVSAVDYVFGRTVHMNVWYEDAGATTDRFKAAFKANVLAAIPDIDYGGLYFAKVVQQTGDSIDVQPEDARLPGMAAVPLLLGVPGSSVNNVEGGRVLVGWSGRDPSKPFALMFDGGTGIPAIDQGTLALGRGSAGVARVGDTAKVTMTPDDVVALAASMVAAGLVLPGSPTGSPPAPVPLLKGEVTSGSSIIKAG